MDTGAKISLIYPKTVKQLRIPYQDKKEPIELRMADRTNPTYGGGIAYLETQKATVKIEGRLFNMKFNITKLSKEGIILGMPWFKAAKLQFDWEREKLI